MASEKPMMIEVSSIEDRKTIVSILHTNGYTTRPIKIKKSAKGMGYGIEFFRENITIDARVGASDEG